MRTKPADERRTDLLDAGQALFLDKGVAAATVDEITRRAGVAKGTFYLYFRSKDDLLTALQTRFSHDFAARVIEATDRSRSWPGKLDAAVRACFDHYRAVEALHDVLFHHTGGPGDDAVGDPAANHLVGAIRQLLADGTEAGAYQVDDPELTAVLLYSAVHLAFDAACHRPDGIDHDRLLAATQTLFRRTADCQ
jgi:TetR/AcrR family transcriptional regulator, transcriptional repressor for nem operon